jgi:hypothetical protein
VIGDRLLRRFRVFLEPPHAVGEPYAGDASPAISRRAQPCRRERCTIAVRTV